VKNTDCSAPNLGMNRDDRYSITSSISDLALTGDVKDMLPNKHYLRPDSPDEADSLNVSGNFHQPLSPISPISINTAANRARRASSNLRQRTSRKSVDTAVINNWKKQVEDNKTSNEADSAPPLDSSLIPLIAELEQLWGSYDGLSELRIPNMINDAVDIAVEKDALHILDLGFGDLDKEATTNFLMLKKDLERRIRLKADMDTNDIEQAKMEQMEPDRFEKGFKTIRLVRYDSYRVIHQVQSKESAAALSVPALLVTYHNLDFPVRNLEKDIAFMRLLSFHPCCVSIIGVVSGRPQLLLEQQAASAFSLEQLLSATPESEAGKIREKLASAGLRKRLALAAEICSTVQFMHRVGVKDLRIRSDAV
jgi:hypothetical protein